MEMKKNDPRSTAAMLIPQSLGDLKVMEISVKYCVPMEPEEDDDEEGCDHPEDVEQDSMEPEQDAEKKPVQPEEDSMEPEQDMNPRHAGPRFPMSRPGYRPAKKA